MSSQHPVIFIHGFIGTLDVKVCEAPYAQPHLLGYGEHQPVPADQISLPAQVEHLRTFIDAQIGATTIDIVGHSVGGAIAMLFAHAHPLRVRRIVNVEGNFTLDDAFWSASVGRMTPCEAEHMLNGFKADPLRWLSGAVTDITPEMESTAVRWIDHQPASTLRAMGQSVVEVTGQVDYLNVVREVFNRHPVYLLAGERSRANWNVPDWALAACAGYKTLPRCGHLMTIEDPYAFATSISEFLSQRLMSKGV